MSKKKKKRKFRPLFRVTNHEPREVFVTVAHGETLETNGYAVINWEQRTITMIGSEKFDYNGYEWRRKLSGGGPVVNQFAPMSDRQKIGHHQTDPVLADRKGWPDSEYPVQRTHLAEALLKPVP